MAIIPDSCRVDPAKQKMPATPPPEIAAKKPPACEAGIGCICRGTVLHKKIDIPPCERNCPTSKGSNLPNHQCFYQDEVVTPDDHTCCCKMWWQPRRQGPMQPLPTSPTLQTLQGLKVKKNVFDMDNECTT